MTLYAWTTAARRPRVYEGFDDTSGDDDPTDSTVGTFHQLYPLAPAFSETR